MHLSALLLAFAAFVQDDEIPVARPLDSLDGNPIAEQYVEAASMLVGRALTQNRAMDTIETLCNEIGPRLTGSREADEAVRWAVKRLREDGFQNVRLEPVMVPVWRRGHCHVSMLAPRPMTLVACALGGSVGTNGVVEGEVVVVEDIDALKALEPGAVEGRIVMFNRRMQPSSILSTDYGGTVSIRTSGAAAAGEAGAIASIARSVGTDRARLAHTGAMNYKDGVPQIPAIAVAGEDADLIASLTSRGHRVAVSIDLGCETLEDKESANVVAEVVGREKPDEVVVIGGHLDSWDLGTGALDDGAGVVICWEAARLMLETGLIPRRTVRLVLFMNEENGLRGGRAYASTHEAEMSKHIAAIEADSGCGRPTGFGAGVPPAGLAVLQQAGALLQGVGASRVTRGGGGADIGPMRAHGVPLIGLRQDMTVYFDYHHTEADTVDKVDPHLMAQNIAAMAVMAYVIADLEEPLARE